MLETLAQVYAPLGKKPSRWAGTNEFEKFVETWGRSDVCFGLADADGMTLETPFGNDSALIQFLTAEGYPQLGHGLLVTLQLPSDCDDPLIAARTAAQLNYFEGCVCRKLGSDTLVVQSADNCMGYDAPCPSNRTR